MERLEALAGQLLSEGWPVLMQGQLIHHIMLRVLLLLLAGMLAMEAMAGMLARLEVFPDQQPRRADLELPAEWVAPRTLAG